MSQELGERLWREYGDRVAVEFPSPKTGGRWQLTARNWAGYIPLSEEVGISLLPQVGPLDLFRMLEYAYDLQSFRFLGSLFETGSLENFYNILAKALARMILARERRGLYREYIGRHGPLMHLRGRMDAERAARKPWGVELWCRYLERTADIEDNRILAWTSFVLGRSGILEEETAGLVRKAHHGLRATVGLHPIGPETCTGRAYNRLNTDYAPLHALCRFFLEHTGPAHGGRGRWMLPFLVDTARLYERFVARWLEENLPDRVRAIPQVRVPVGGSLQFAIDLVLCDAATGAALCVLDTKYKFAPTPDTSDIAQVVAYAEAKRCREAVLVYPTLLTEAFEAKVGGIRVRALTFSPGFDLEESGRTFVRELLAWDEPQASRASPSGPRLNP